MLIIIILVRVVHYIVFPVQCPLLWALMHLQNRSNCTALLGGESWICRVLDLIFFEIIRAQLVIHTIRDHLNY